LIDSSKAESNDSITKQLVFDLSQTYYQNNLNEMILDRAAIQLRCLQN